jgi:uroporphyrinogen decarboxylase
VTQGRSLAPAFSFLRACRGEPITETPIWIMRQAGRYLPEDILIPLLGLGVPLDFDPGPKLGLKIAHREDVERLRWQGTDALPHIRPVIRAARERLAGRVPLIGFAGAPFTVGAYLIEGGGARDLSRTRAFLARDPDSFAQLLDLLATATIDYLKAQIGAGVDAVMLFDTQAGWLPPAEFARTAAALADRVLRALPKGTPTIYFALAPSVGHLEALRSVHADVFGLDYRVSLAQARAILGNSKSVQGNLDPAVLLGPGEEIVVGAEAVLRENRGRPGHIFNLGHGIFPDTPIENVKLLVDTVKRYRAHG